MEERPAPNIRYIATLVVVAGLILVVGSLLRPRARSAEQATPTDTDLARLSRLTERRSLESRIELFRQVAADVAASVVWLGETGSSGVVWGPNTVATARLAAKYPSPGALGGGDAAVRVTGVEWTPLLPVAEVRMAGLRVPAPVRAADAMESGQPLVAVWRTAEGRAFAGAAFAGVTTTTCGDRSVREVVTTVALTRPMAGGGLFDLDANLVALVVPCADRFAALAPDAVDGILREVVSFDNRLLARYGLLVGALTEAEISHFAVSAGAMVRETVVGDLADQAGLRPGDLIVAINGSAVAQPADLQPLASRTPLAAPVVSLRRAGVALEVALAPPPRAVQAESADTAAAPPASGLVWDARQPELKIQAVAPGSRAAAAGLRAGDRIVRLGSRQPRSLDEIRRLLDARRAPAVFVEVERGARRWGTLLPQAQP